MKELLLEKGHMQSPCRQSSSLPTCLPCVEAWAGKERAQILTNDQSEGLHDGATCVPEHSMNALGQALFHLMKDILSQYICIYGYPHPPLLILPSFPCNCHSLHGEM